MDDRSTRTESQQIVLTLSSCPILSGADENHCTEPTIIIGVSRDRTDGDQSWCMYKVRRFFG